MTTLWSLYMSLVTMDLVRCSLHPFFQVLPEPWSCVIPTWVLSKMRPHICFSKTGITPIPSCPRPRPRQVLPQYFLVQDPVRPRLPSLVPVLSQHWPDQDCRVSTSFLVSVMRWSWNSFTRLQAPSVPALVGVSPSGAVLGYSENYRGFRILAPFTSFSDIKTLLDTVIWQHLGFCYQYSWQ